MIHWMEIEGASPILALFLVVVPCAGDFLSTVWKTITNGLSIDEKTLLWRIDGLLGKAKGTTVGEKST